MLKRAAVVALVGAGAAAAYRAASGGKGQEDVEVTYPPTDTLKPVAENIWIVDSGPLTAMGIALPIRMTVIRLESGDLLLHSPTQFSPALARQIDDLGPVRHLVAPSIGHWKYLQAWQDAYADATTWAVPGLRNRSQVRKSAVRLDRDLGVIAPSAWADEIEQRIVEGAGFKEAYLFHRPTGTLVLTDLVDNLEESKLPSTTALAMKVASATNGTTPAHVRAALLLGGTRSKEGVRHMLSLNAERVIFAHGNWFAENGSERLRRAFDWLLRSS